MTQVKPKLNVKELLESFGIGKEEAIAKSIEKLTDQEKVEFLSYLYPLEDDGLSWMLVLARRYGYGWLRQWVYQKLVLRASLFGWRANQITSIASEKRKEEKGFRFLGFLKRKKKEKGMGEVEYFE